jgi:hypothetical protein
MAKKGGFDRKMKDLQRKITNLDRKVSQGVGKARNMQRKAQSGINQFRNSPIGQSINLASGGQLGTVLDTVSRVNDTIIRTEDGYLKVRSSVKRAGFDFN